MKNKTTILVGGRQWSSLLLTFSGAILRPFLFISALLFSILSFQTPSLFYCSLNPFQLGCTSLLALHQVPKRLPNFLVLLHEFLKCLFNDIQNSAISRNYSWSVGVGVEYILLLKGNIPGIYEGSAMKEKY